MAASTFWSIGAWERGYSATFVEGTALYIAVYMIVLVS